MKNLLNVAGQTFIISGFMFFLLAVPLYYVYPPLYTSVIEHTEGLIFFSYLGLIWTFFGLYPIILSMAIRELNIGDLVLWDGSTLTKNAPAESTPGIVVDKVDGVPIGWYDENNERPTTFRYKVFWQDLQGFGWYWPEDIAHCEENNRSDKQEHHD